MIEQATTGRGKRILVIPDLHAPFVHRDALAFVKRLQREFDTDTTVFLGDEIDSHAVSNYQSDPDGDSAGREMEKAIEELKPWYEAFPKAYVCASNHTMRPWIKMASAGLPRRMQPKIREVLGAPDGWRWAEHWRIGNVVYEHGDAIQGGEFPHATAMKRNLVSTIIGHHHGRFAVEWHRTPHRMVFGMALGCLIDETSYAFAYGRKSKVKPILGAGVVLNGQPVICKMLLTPSGRWRGEILPQKVRKGQDIVEK